MVIASSTTLTCLIPPHAAGAVDVVVAVGSESKTLAAGLTYSGLNTGFNSYSTIPTTLTTAAGVINASGAALNATGTGARFYSPSAVAADGSYVYIADTWNHYVRKYNLSTGAVTSMGGYAEVMAPSAMTMHGSDLYVAGYYGIYRWGGASFTKIAGATCASSCTTDGVGTIATFSTSLLGLASDGTYIYITDTGNHTIRRLDPANSYTVTTLTGVAGTAGSVDTASGPPKFYSPTGIAVHGTNLYVSEPNPHRIRKIALASANAVTTYAGGTLGTDDGTGTSAKFKAPKGLIVDSGILYVADSTLIRAIDLSNAAVTTIAGGGSAQDGNGTAAGFGTACGITLSSGDAGYAYAVDNTYGNVRRIGLSAPHAVTTVAGPATGTAGISGTTNGTGSAARFYYPMGLATDNTNLYIVDAYNNKIRKMVISTKAVTDFLGSGYSNTTDGNGLAAAFNYPIALTILGTKMYILEYAYIRMVNLTDSNLAVTTIAGGGYGSDPATDGIGTNARFVSPTSIVSAGNYLYVLEQSGSVIRRVNLVDGVYTVDTLAGTAGSYTSTNGPGASATLGSGADLLVYGTKLYFSDTYDGSIRTIDLADPDHTVATFFAYGGGLSSPQALATDGTYLFVLDGNLDKIFRIPFASSSTLLSLAGQAAKKDDVDGPVASAYLSYTNHMIVTTSGIFFPTDYGIRWLY